MPNTAPAAQDSLAPTPTLPLSPGAKAFIASLGIDLAGLITLGMTNFVQSSDSENYFTNLEKNMKTPAYYGAVAGLGALTLVSFIALTFKGWRSSPPSTPTERSALLMQAADSKGYHTHNLATSINP